MSQRPLLDPTHVSPAVLDSMAAFHADILGQVSSTVANHDVVVVGMAQNPVVKKARKALDAAGIPFEYLEYGSYFSQWKERLAIKMWSGFPTFPQVFVKGTLVGGNARLRAAIADGSFQALLDGPRASGG